MDINMDKFGVHAKKLAKNPLEIIALFIFLIYGFASLVTGFSTSPLTAEERTPLIYFLAGYPILVLGVFAWLVSQHSNKLYGPSDFQNEKNFMEMQFSVATALGAAAASQSQDNIDSIDSNMIADAISTFAFASSRQTTFAKRILWVDDRPEHNVYVRKAFEAMGLSVAIALSTTDALNTLQNGTFVAIISDMERREGAQEGYALLKEIRNNKCKIPFFFYSGSNTPEDYQTALALGAQGRTSDSGELFVLVTKAVINGDSE